MHAVNESGPEGTTRTAPGRKSVVITGASSGIGRATALRLARKGWQVFATVRKQADAEALKEAAGRHLETVHLDLTDEDSVITAARQIAEVLGDRGLDGLVNNAGMGILSPVEHITGDQLRHVYQVNVFGQIATIRALLPTLRRARGRIINVGSVGDHISPPFAAALASPKAAFASTTGALRLELRSQDIQVCLVEPGSINTPAVNKTLGDIDATIRAMPDDAADLYGPELRSMATTFAANERSGSAPETVAAVVERALTDRRPKLRYPAGKDARKLTLLARLLPERIVDRALLRTFGLTSSSTT
jgi:NAD(P)-dependent dehydrogenase (short-subunit alcohol dehydrogenase family)